MSVIFLSPLVGYTASALANNLVHVKFGQRGVAAGCSAFHLLAYVVISLHPPYPVIVISYMAAGFGNGLADAGYNAFFGSLGSANEMLGFLHASYGVGAVIAPFVATTLVTRAGLPWYTWYYIMVCAFFVCGSLLWINSTVPIVGNIFDAVIVFVAGIACCCCYHHFYYCRYNCRYHYHYHYQIWLHTYPPP